MWNRNLDWISATQSELSFIKKVEVVKEKVFFFLIFLEMKRMRKPTRKEKLLNVKPQPLTRLKSFY